MFDGLIRKAHKAIALIEKGMPCQTVSMNGKVVRLPSATFTGVDRWVETWKSQLIGGLLHDNDAALFVDVGANVGQSLLDFLALNKSGTYFGIEPNPACAAQVQRIIDLNDLKNAFVLPICCHEHPDIFAFYRGVGAETDESASTVQNLRPGQSVSKIFVPGFPFDYIVKALAWPTIDLVKIDVEGAELAVLLGMNKTLKELRPVIICEVLRADALANLATYASTTKTLFAFLKNNRYSVFSIVKHNDATLKHIERIESFPLDLWCKETAHACDYLFVPDERERALTF